MRRIASRASFLLLLGGCASAAPESAPAPAPEPVVAPGAIPADAGAAAAHADSVRRSHTQADVDFMTGMIHHHAQALVMTDMARRNDPGPRLRVLAARITNAQNDEIRQMSDWLRDVGVEPPVVSAPGYTGPNRAPAGHAGHAEHGGHGMHHDMPGMLSPEQLARLEAARGYEFDRLFLTYMIQHHQGALTMVETLFSTYGAAQNDAVFKLASDIGAEQASEIERMQMMLRDLMFDTGAS